MNYRCSLDPSYQWEKKIERDGEFLWAHQQLDAQTKQTMSSKHYFEFSPKLDDNQSQCVSYIHEKHDFLLCAAHESHEQCWSP